MDRDQDRDWRDRELDYDLYIPPYDRSMAKESTAIDLEKFMIEDVLVRILSKVEGIDKRF